MASHFRSKVDLLLVVPLALGLLVPVVLLIRAFVTGRQGGMATAFLLLLVVTLGSFARVSYSVTASDIVVRRGLLRSKMPLARVRQLRATREALAAPALSLDRIEIRTDRGMWLIVSPADKGGFVRAIQRHAPAVELVGLEGAMGPQGGRAS
jgi:hypothetical protein